MEGRARNQTCILGLCSAHSFTCLISFNPQSNSLQEVQLTQCHLYPWGSQRLSFSCELNGRAEASNLDLSSPRSQPPHSSPIFELRLNARVNQTQTEPQAALRQAGKQTGKLHHYSSLHTARCSAPSRLPQAAPSAPRLTWQASSLHPSKAVPASLFSKGYSVISSESLIKGYTKYVVSGRANYHLPGQCRSAALNPGLLTNSPVSCGTQVYYRIPLTSAVWALR